MNIRRYFFGIVAGIALILLPVLMFVPQGQAPKFPLDTLSHTFVPFYKGDIAHRIFYFGLFGFNKTMSEADVIITGTSRPQLALSANQMSEALTRLAGRQVKVVNIGIGPMEGFPFAKKVILRNDLSCSILLLDLYHTLLDKISNDALPALTESRASAYVRVVDGWSAMLKDWLLDGWLPRISYVEKEIRIQRFLAHPVGFREWKTGDLWDIWFPTTGFKYRTPQEDNIPKDMWFAKEGTIDTKRPPTFDPRVIPSINAAKAKEILDLPLLDARSLMLLTTAVPLMHRGYEDSLFRQMAVTLNVPYVPILNHNLKYIDMMHTNADGRALATEAFIEGLKRKEKVFLKMLEMARECRSIRH